MKFKLKKQLVLAPLAGITDRKYRDLCRKYGASLCFTEMISANALSRLKKTTISMVDTQDEKNAGVQLFGQNIENIKKSAEFILKNKLAAVLDFNLGCSAIKILKQGAGAALLKRPNQVKKILDAIVEIASSYKIPVSAKIRSGIDNKHINAVEIAQIIEDAGCSFITVHPRTLVQGFSGKADWDIIRQIKEKVSIPVIGNGDIFTPQDAKRMYDETNCDSIMIGRGAIGNPFIFKQISAYLNSGKLLEPMELKERLCLFLELAQEKNIADSTALAKLKQQAMWFTKAGYNVKRLRDKIRFCKTTDELIKLVQEYANP